MKRPPLSLDLLRLLNVPNISDRNATEELLGRAPLSIDETLARTVRELSSVKRAASRFEG